MSNNEREIVPGSQVTMHFSLSLPDGTEAISTFEEEPLSFAMGDNTLQPGLELGLYGLKAGDSQTLILTPEQGYGEHDPNMVYTMPLSDFPADMQPEVGQIMAFTTPTGDEAAGSILAVEGDEVKVDFNHPLAGREVIYKVEILDVGVPLPQQEDAADGENQNDSDCSSC